MGAFPEKGIASSWGKLLQCNSEQPRDVQGSAVQGSEPELQHPGRDRQLSLAVPVHVLRLHKQLLLPTAGGLSLCASVLPFQLWKEDIYWSLWDI